jgi:hypothetical protein
VGGRTRSLRGCGRFHVGASGIQKGDWVNGYVIFRKRSKWRWTGIVRPAVVLRGGMEVREGRFKCW